MKETEKRTTEEGEDIILIKLIMIVMTQTEKQFNWY